MEVGRLPRLHRRQAQRRSTPAGHTVAAIRHVRSPACHTRPAGRHRRSDRRVCFLFLGSTSTGHLDWRSALPLIGLTAWADVRGLANSLFTPLHCSERVRDFRWINPVWINGLKSAGVRALEFPPPPDHTRTLARDVPPVHRLTTCWAPRRTSPSLIPHLSPSIRHSTPLLPFVLVAVFSHCSLGVPLTLHSLVST